MRREPAHGPRLGIGDHALGAHAGDATQGGHQASRGGFRTGPCPLPGNSSRAEVDFEAGTVGGCGAPVRGPSPHTLHLSLTSASGPSRPLQLA